MKNKKSNNLESNLNTRNQVILFLNYSYKSFYDFHCSESMHSKYAKGYIYWKPIDIAYSCNMDSMLSDSTLGTNARPSRVESRNILELVLPASTSSKG